MSTITIRTVSIHEENGYCSQKRRPIPSIETIEEGVAVIEMLLEKKILCSHDVEDINKTYQTINDLEKRMTLKSEYSSGDAIKKIIDKVERIYFSQLVMVSEKDLISLYHLQKFSDKDLKINIIFNKLLEELNIKKGSFLVSRITASLPYCYSKSRFQKDLELFFSVKAFRTSDDFEKNNLSMPVMVSTISSLFGFKTNQPQLLTILEDALLGKAVKQKKDKLESYENLKKSISNDKLELKNNDYPAYFDELIDNGYLHLYHHLIEMMQNSDDKSRTDKINKLSFSEVSHIILETREAVIRKVENAIPPHFDCNKIIFLLGLSGSGKSTTLCFLRGDKMEYRKKFNDYISTNDSTLIGKDTTRSCTLTPNVEIVNGFAFVDFPGFVDTNGNLISMGIEFALKALVNKFRPKILILSPITHKDKYVAAGNLGERLDRLFGDMKKFCVLGITQYSQNPNYKNILTIKEKLKKFEGKKSSIEDAENGLVNLNEQLNKDGLSNEKKKEIEKQIYKQEMKIEILKEQYETETKDAESLKDLKELNDQKEELQKSESDLMKKMGLEELMRFDELTDSDHHSDYFKIFSSIKHIRTNSDKTLDAENKSFLTTLFDKNLSQSITDQADEASWRDMTDLKAKLWESSLIKNILPDGHSEIVELLHLPEIDPTIIHAFDQKMVDDCVEAFKNACFESFDKNRFDELMNQEKNDDKKKELKEKMDELMKLVITRTTKEDTEGDQIWKTWQKQQKRHKQSIEKQHELSTWSTVALTVAFVFPLFIGWKVMSNRKQDALNKLHEQSIEEYSQLVSKTSEAILKLNGLKRIVERSETVDKIIGSKPIVTNSLASLLGSIKGRIANMREHFEDGEAWDEHVSILAKTYKADFTYDSKDFDSENPLHCLCVLAYVYFLVEPHLQFEFLRAPLSKIKKPWEIRVCEGGVKMFDISPKKDDIKIPGFFKDIQQIDYELHPLTNLWSAAAILEIFSFDAIPDLEEYEEFYSIILNGETLLA
jgi:hypothetical protein